VLDQHNVKAQVDRFVYGVDAPTDYEQGARGSAAFCCHEPR